MYSSTAFGIVKFRGARIDQILCFEDRASLYNHLQIKPTRCTYFLVYLFSLLYVFRASICPSLGELTVSMRHWYLSLSRQPPIQSDKYQGRIDTVSSLDDGHIDARNT